MNSPKPDISTELLTTLNNPKNVIEPQIGELNCAELDYTRTRT